VSSKIQNPKPCTGVRGVSPGRDSFAYSGLGRGCSSYLTRSCSAERASAACASADRHAAKCAKGKFDGSPAYCLLSWSSANSPSSPVFARMHRTRYTSTRAHGHAVAAECTMRTWRTDTHAGRPAGMQASRPPSLYCPFSLRRHADAGMHARTHMRTCKLSRAIMQSIRVQHHTFLQAM
jgi:hypothetical protein